ncbi:hypothetical protein FB451DRAFT_984279, partial [Mycena latifolia]
LNELEDSRWAIQQQIDCSIYPILTLPPEITSENFVNCLPNINNSQPDPLKAPLLLLNICSTWKKFVLSTPALWD